MNHRLLFASLAGLIAFAPLTQAESAKPIRVLLVTGGCCHDYEKQHLILAEGIGARANVEVTFAHNPDKTTKCSFDLYKNKDWAKPFDVVIHDECSADVTDPEYVNNIVDAHRKGTPGVNLHCAMHCYRWGNFKEPVAPGADNSHWYEMLGLQSTGHGPQAPIALNFIDKDSPIVKGMSNWTTINEELYNNIQILTAKALVKGKQTQVDKKTGTSKEAETVVAWTNEFGANKTKIFSTTIGHNNDTVGDARYLDMVTRGLLWATGHITDDGKPAAGYEPKK
ncbi:MAG: Trehalose utilization [Verrucomicrobiaceae bacterium]|nr:Trehalose utilization [Verrucomicrobiaceae bacterium]